MMPRRLLAAERLARARRKVILQAAARLDRTHFRDAAIFLDRSTSRIRMRDTRSINLRQYTRNRHMHM